MTTFQPLFSIFLIVTVLVSFRSVESAYKSRERERSCKWNECRTIERWTSYLSYIFSVILWEVVCCIENMSPHICEFKITIIIRGNCQSAWLSKVIFYQTVKLIHSPTFWFTLLLMITNNNIMESFVRCYGYFSHQITFKLDV